MRIAAQQSRLVRLDSRERSRTASTSRDGYFATQALVGDPRDDDSLNGSQEEPWSPARARHAIAVSQSWWALQAAALFAADARRSTGTPQQIYARQMFGYLRALRRCAEMQATELERIAIDETQRARLDREIERFDEAAPAAKPGRDILEHFDEYARGEGRLQREAIRNLGPIPFP